MLIPTPRLVLASTAFAQADARPRSSATAVWLIMTTAHGSASPKGQPGVNAQTFASGAYRNREANLYFRAGTRQPRKRLENGVAKKTTRKREPDREGNSSRKASPRRPLKETAKRLALSKRLQLALFCRSVSLRLSSKQLKYPCKATAAKFRGRPLANHQSTRRISSASNERNGTGSKCASAWRISVSNIKSLHNRGGTFFPRKKYSS